MLFKIKTKLASPEAALLLSELYDREYTDLSMDKVKENALGAVLKRNMESFKPYNRTQEIMSLYIKFKIQKLFNISYLEFKSLTKYERTIMIETAIEEIKRMDEELERLKDGADSAKQELSNLAMPGYDIGDFNG